MAPLTLLGGYLGGLYTGFMVGFLSMLISDMFIGVGPWTPVTSFFMGIVGLFGATVCRKYRDAFSLFLFSYISVLMYDVATSIVPSIFFGVPVFIALINLFLPVFFLGIPYPMGPVHELSSSFIFVALVKSLEKFDIVGGLNGE